MNRNGLMRSSRAPSMHPSCWRNIATFRAWSGGGTSTETQSDNRGMEPRVAVAPMPLESTDGTFTIGRDAFPDFGRLARLGVHIQSDRVRVAEPDPGYVRTGLDALTEACRQLDIPEASIVFVDTVEPPPAIGLRYGFKGSYTTDYPTIIWFFANWTRRDELRELVRHQAAHLAFARTHTAEESAGHSGPSEDFALEFERDVISR